MSLPYVTVQLGGKERHLRYTMESMAQVEERLGLTNIFAFDELKAVPLGARTMRTWIWAGLLHESPELSESEVGNWIDGENFIALSEAFSQALARFFPKPNGKEAGEERPLPRSAGKRSKNLPTVPSPSSPPNSGAPA